MALPPVGPAAVPGKEYSNHFDETAAGVADAEQAIFWDGTGVAFDTFDYTPAPGPVRIPALPAAHERPETDALAFDNDRFFLSLRANTVALVFSTDADPAISYEDTGGAGGIWALPATINAAVPPDDVDAIEVWGPDSTAGALSGDDGFNYSLEFDPAPVPFPAVAVWHVPGSVPGALGATAFPLLFDFEIAAAIAPLAPAGTTVEDIEPFLDLDGMMLNIGEFVESTGEPVFATRTGSIHFTIDPISDSTGGVIFDGGEIFTWDFVLPGPAGAAAFLFHGGHFWDTAFPVMTTFGTPTENVNGIEAVQEIPEPSSLVLTLLALLSLSGYGRRRKE